MDAFSFSSLQNPALFGPTLMSMFARRSRAIADSPTLLPIDAWYDLAIIPLADHILSRTGAVWGPSKDVSFASDTWVSTMRWGLDHYVYVTYLLRCGRLVAAALATRMFLERWTLNVAHHHGVERKGDQTDAEFMTRAWSVYPELARDHDMGSYWRWLSEYLHGRTDVANDGLYRAQHDTDDSDETSHAWLCRQVSVIAGITLRQVLGSVRVHAQAHGLASLSAKLFKEPVAALSHDSWDEGGAIRNSLHQLDYEFIWSESASALSTSADSYREFVDSRKASIPLRDSLSLDLARVAFVERRSRAIDMARYGFEHEREFFGEDFDPGTLNARLFRYIGIGEMATLCAEAVASAAEQRALRTAADALGAAWFVWLEDTDLSLGCVRILLEQTSRARAHRLKPSRAAGLEQLRVAPAPTRWLEIAGYKRLASYNRALGQFAHIQETIRLSGARSLLEQLQASPAEHPEHTARGDALDEAAYLLAYEVVSRLDQMNARLASLFRKAVTLRTDDEHEERLLSMLNRSLGHRLTDLGGNDFVRQNAPHSCTGPTT
ncbi:hypothetical protein MMARE11_35100 [Mycobacterium marinum E11]|nr:hypothetical protein MMARE11_35100 [Mycobacterium marinum E11]